ncbi:MAG: UDP-N-acetylmuramoyl-L-alanyl-D-glutamate--2,6-diaminopimelate ligase [bacterium]|nr:UDP-N-acetylmuramoyl-L-alanyl-D-glutamate--2,6-diaminopimelate ligase [bacterium]
MLRDVALSTLIGRLPASTQVSGARDRIVNALEIDSRRVRPGAIFVAIHGEKSDGHEFLQAAIAAGAIAVVVEAARGLALHGDVTVLHVPDTRRALSALAAAFYGDPSRALDVIGVTGTNGKTTTTRMIAAICNAALRPCGVIGTVGAEFGERRWPLANTTPLPNELHALLAEMRDAGARAVAMEVSSHALALDRVEDVHFAAAALTNVTRDHLDFHGTIEAYAAAKRRLFTMSDALVLNVDDPHGAQWARELAGRVRTVVTYGDAADAQLRASAIVATPQGSDFAVDGTAVHVNLPGRFNVANALAAIGVARTLGIDDATSARGLAALTRVSGRMEHVGAADVDVVVDYAHTPDALEQALRALRATTAKRLVVVFGCGGDRDRGKRPEMGRIAAQFADAIYVTSDNPRSEAPLAIIGEIEAGIGAHAHVIEPDRRAAIERAVREAHAGDVVLVAGKGHENYQIVGERTLPFDDVAVARDALAARGVPR